MSSLIRSLPLPRESRQLSDHNSHCVWCEAPGISFSIAVHLRGPVSQLWQLPSVALPFRPTPQAVGPSWALWPGVTSFRPSELALQFLYLSYGGIVNATSQLFLELQLSLLNDTCTCFYVLQGNMSPSVGNVFSSSS